MKRRGETIVQGAIRTVLVLVVCAGFPAVASAQNDVEQARKPDPFRDVSRSLKMRTTVPDAPDWVTRTRKPDSELNFIPTGAAGRREPAPLLTPDRLRQIEKDLDAARANHDRIGARTAAPPPRRSVAMDPIAKKKRAPRPCVLTCASPIGSTKKR